MKVERKKASERPLVQYDDLIAGHLYIDASDPDDLDVYLATDEGVASLESGYFYPSREVGEDVFPNSSEWVEVGGKVVIEE